MSFIATFCYSDNSMTDSNVYKFEHWLNISSLLPVYNEFYSHFLLFSLLLLPGVYKIGALTDYFLSMMTFIATFCYSDNSMTDSNIYKFEHWLNISSLLPFNNEFYSHSLLFSLLLLPGVYKIGALTDYFLSTMSFIASFCYSHTITSWCI